MLSNLFKRKKKPLPKYCPEAQERLRIANKAACNKVKEKSEELDQTITSWTKQRFKHG